MHGQLQTRGQGFSKRPSPRLRRAYGVTLLGQGQYPFANSFRCSSIFSHCNWQVHYMFIASMSSWSSVIIVCPTQNEIVVTRKCQLRWRKPCSTQRGKVLLHNTIIPVQMDLNNMTGTRGGIINMFCTLMNCYLTMAPSPTCSTSWRRSLLN